MIRAALLWLTVVGTASAQQLPALYDVSGVAAEDVLNIRAAPAAEAGILGSLPADATGIEVTALSESGTWGRLNSAEGVGWVSMTYLDMQPMGDQPLPDQLACFGTEPFWAVDARQNGLTTVTMPDEDDRSFATQSFLRSGNRTDTYALADFGFTLILRREHCSDGMSDRLYGLSSVVVLPGPTRLLSGCCTLQSDR